MVKVFRPKSGSTFTIDELNDEVGGWIEPFRVGPIWVMYLEKADRKGKQFNFLASHFFDLSLYGEVLVVPPQQMPAEWGAMEEGDEHYTADMIDSAFLLSLQNSILLAKMKEQVPGFVVDPAEFFSSKFNVKPKEEYTYDPPEDTDENTRDFLDQVYGYISKSPAQFRKGVLLDGPEVIIRAEQNKLKKVLKMMTDMYIETEEYEKCAVIRELEENIQ